ncbi:MAG: LacI family transcriptional regulator [candidate division KSB1 bacterium]|nr:LacI family transcriptional regulator [candidate division KSB1 bacterium]
MSRERPRFATIEDVARRAGVSKMTVSRVIRGHASVRAETRERVLRAIEELDYFPNSTARALVNDVTTNVGLVVGHPPRFDDFFNYVAKGAELELARRGYSLILVMQQLDEGDLPMVVRQRKVDGLLLGGPEIRQTLIESLQAKHIPCVLLANRVDYPPVPSVCADDFGGAMAAVQHLVSLGHERIAFVGTRRTFYHVQERFRGYAVALKMAGLPVRPEWCVEVAYSQEEGRSASRELLEKPDRPTAIFYSGDLLALGGIEAARDLGLSVPGDVAVVGFDDIQTAALLDPPLTTVRVDKEEMGRLAVELLFEAMENPSAQPRAVKIPTELVIRRSCGAAIVGQ